MTTEKLNSAEQKYITEGSIFPVDAEPWLDEMSMEFTTDEERANFREINGVSSSGQEANEGDVSFF